MRHKSGFTLIELSIVLVIIGLIVGGVLVGRDLIASAQIRAQIKQIDEFKLAANSFKIKYGQLPGDISPTQTAALGFFTFTGVFAGQSALMATGGGDIRMGWGNEDSAVSNGETYVFWRHLTEAKMISGTQLDSAAGYIRTDASGVLSNAGIPTNNSTLYLPSGKLTDTSSIQSEEANSYTNLVQYPQTTRKNVYIVGNTTARQKYSIDSKIDDGMPSSGIVRDFDVLEFYGSGATCNTGTPKAYRLNDTTTDAISSLCRLSILW